MLFPLYYVDPQIVISFPQIKLVMLQLLDRFLVQQQHFPRLVTESVGPSEFASANDLPPLNYS